MQTESFLYFCGVISKNKIKLIRALETKKGRVKHGMFVAEGPKIVGDLLAAGFHLVELFDDEDDIKKVSFLQHPQGKVGVFRLPDYVETAHDEHETAVDEKCMPMLGEHELALALDGVQDPGNLGTIIRVADWFGIKRVQICYLNLEDLINKLPSDYPVYGTLLDGDDIYTEKLTHHGIIVMGNEGNGISAVIRKYVNRKLLIPNFSIGTTRAESLNVAVATAIVCSEFRRRG